MKFDWREFFQALQVLGGFTAAAVVLTFFLGTVRGCDVVMEQRKTERLQAKAKAYQVCIEKTEKPLECRDSLRDLH